MNNNRTWEALSMKDRASFIKLAMQNGYRDLDSIRSLYNNKSKEDAEGFSRWKKQIKNYKGIDVDKDDTYDYRGFYFDNPDNAWKLLKDRPDAHFTDKFKTSKHPTFSNESIYSGVKHQYNPNGIKGGKWLDDYNYIMSDDMLKASNYDISNTRKYLDEAESQHVNVYAPDGSIVMEPITVTNKYGDGGTKKSFWNYVTEAALDRRDARTGAVGARLVRDLHNAGKHQEAQDLAKTYAKANVAGMSLAGGYASPSLLGDLITTTGTTFLDTFIDGNYNNLGKNLATNIGLDLLGNSIKYLPGTYKMLTNPQYRRNHVYYNIAPFGYDDRIKRGKEALYSMLLDKPINVDSPKWYTEDFITDLREGYRINDELLAAQVRDDAWRIYNGIPQRHNSYIRNSDGTYSYNLNELNGQWVGFHNPQIATYDFVTGSGGGLTGNAGTLLGRDFFSGEDYYLRTIRDTWDLHPFSASSDTFSSLLTKRLNNISKNSKFKTVVNKVVPNIPGVKWVDRRLKNLEVGSLYGGKPFEMITDVPITIKGFYPEQYNFIPRAFYGVDNAKTTFNISLPEAKKVNRLLLSNPKTSFTTSANNINEHVFNSFIKPINTDIIRLNPTKALGGPLYNEDNPIEAFQGNPYIPVVRYDDGGFKIKKGYTGYGTNLYNATVPDNMSILPTKPATPFILGPQAFNPIPFIYNPKVFNLRPISYFDHVDIERTGEIPHNVSMEGVQDITEDVNNGAYYLYPQSRDPFYKNDQIVLHDGRYYRISDRSYYDGMKLAPLDLSNFTHWGISDFRNQVLPKRDYIGSDAKNNKDRNFETRTKVIQRVPNMIDDVYSLSEQYGIDPNVLFNRLYHEGILDHFAATYNELNTVDQSSYWDKIKDETFNGFEHFGLDNTVRLIQDGLVKPQRDIHFDVERNFNEKDEEVISPINISLYDALELKAAELQYRQEVLKKRGVNDADMSTWLNAAYNLGLYHKDLEDRQYIIDNYTVPNYNFLQK